MAAALAFQTHSVVAVLSYVSPRAAGSSVAFGGIARQAAGAGPLLAALAAQVRGACVMSAACCVV